MAYWDLKDKPEKIKRKHRLPIINGYIPTEIKIDNSKRFAVLTFRKSKR
jgi:hypothetical protein